MGEVKIEGKRLALRFFGDNKQMLIKASEIAKNREDCDSAEPVAVEYYVANISGSDLKKISQDKYLEHISLLKDEKLPAKIEYSPSGDRKIIIKGKEIVTGNQESELNLIGSYYQ
jgi:hypothetical protein